MLHSRKRCDILSSPLQKGQRTPSLEHYQQLNYWRIKHRFCCTSWWQHRSLAWGTGSRKSSLLSSEQRPAYIHNMYNSQIIKTYNDSSTTSGLFFTSISKSFTSFAPPAWILSPIWTALCSKSATCTVTFETLKMNLLNRHENEYVRRKSYDAEMVLLEAAGGERRSADAHSAWVQCWGVPEHSILVQSDGSVVANRLHLRTTESLFRSVENSFKRGVRAALHVLVITCGLRSHSTKWFSVPPVARV